MHVGKGLFFQNLDGTRSDGDVLRHELALADRSEADGFQSLWTAEHHFTGYHMCPSVTQVLTYLAGRTSSARLGSMVVVLPWHDPVRVAEELAVIDHLSEGRLVLGLGRGLGRIEFEGFRVDMSESRERFVEYASAVVRAFDEGKVHSDGPLHQQPPVDLRPAPAASLRGRVYASAVSPESMELMARLGFGVMVIAQKPWEVTEREVAAYTERFRDINGFDPPKPILVSFVAVHESAAAAAELYEEQLVRYALSTVEHYRFDDASIAAIPGYEYYGKLSENIDRHGIDKFVRFLADLQVHGTPEEVVDQLTENVRRLDAAGSVVVLSYGTMTPEASSRNHTLFATSVLPRLREIDPDRRLADPPTAS